MKLANLLPWPTCFLEQLVGSQEMPAADVGGWGNRMSWGKEVQRGRSVLYTGDGGMSERYMQQVACYKVGDEINGFGGEEKEVKIFC